MCIDSLPFYLLFGIRDRVLFCGVLVDVLFRLTTELDCAQKIQRLNSVLLIRFLERIKFQFVSKNI